MLNNINKMTLALAVMVVLAGLTTIASAQYDDINWGEEEAILFGLGLTMCLIIVIIPLILGILLCIWIYKDAEKRGKSGAIWVIVLILASLFLSFIGLIIVIVIWLATRPPIGGEKPVDSSDRRCPNCGRTIPMDAKACPYCAKKFEE